MALTALKIVLILLTLVQIGQGNSNGSVSKKNGQVFVNVYNNWSNKALINWFGRLEARLKRLENKVFGNKKCKKVLRNCDELLKCGKKQSGVYTINPDGKGSLKVYCDQTTAGGGWTVFQRRQDGSVNFYRGWHDYKTGFGDKTGEFWLGLDSINRLTHQTRNKLRVDLEDAKGKWAYAEYDLFAVASENAKYKLSLGTYSGTAGDSLSFHRGQAFSTMDRDNDASRTHNCARLTKGAWWYGGCLHSNLNGVYHLGKHNKSWKGVLWYHWKGHSYSLKRAEMKIRPE